MPYGPKVRLPPSCLPEHPVSASTEEIGKKEQTDDCCICGDGQDIDADQVSVESKIKPSCHAHTSCYVTPDHAPFSSSLCVLALCRLLLPVQ